MKRPVKMLTQIEDTYIDYSVEVDDDGHGDERGRGIWHRRVYFGATDATHAGGHAFVAAAREQQRIADEVHHDGASTPEQLKLKYRHSAGTHGVERLGRV